MKISDIFTAKGLKFKLNYHDSSADFSVGALIRIETTQTPNEFIIRQYGSGTQSNHICDILCSTDKRTSEYLYDLFEAERIGANRCIFSVDGKDDCALEVQAYTFRSVVEYKTPIFIQVADKLLEKTTVAKLYHDFVWDQLGQPALFCLNYKNRKKQQSDIRFISGKLYLKAENTPRGIIAESENYYKDRDTLPVDIYIAPEIHFIAETEVPQINNSLAEDLDKISNPATYFARWEAYNELSKKLLKKESDEFGFINYKSYNIKSDLNGTSFEFYTDEDLDDAIKGKELVVTANDDISEHIKPVCVGEVRRISGKTITTFIESIERFFWIPDSGRLSLYIAGDKAVMARRDAARERMIKNQSPIKYIVPLIETGVSKYGLSCDWGSSKAVTEELKRNFKKACNLNLQQIEALNIAINTPDIAIIQGPPGTGKTTVIKAICERFREIFEAEERKLQKINPDYALHSPKILISSFQNEAVDNAIIAPLPGDIPAYRKTGHRTKGDTAKKYQTTLDSWYNGVSGSITELISDKTTIEFVANKKRLSDEYISYKNSGEELSRAAKLIKQYLEYVDISYPQEIIAAAQSVIRAAENSVGIDDVPDPIVAKLEAQRLEKEAFADDGQRNAQRLLAYIRIREDLNIDVKDILAIQMVCDKEPTAEEYAEYVKVILKLQKTFCRHKNIIDVKDKAVVNECLLSLHDCFVKQYINTLSDIESKKSLILSEFLSRLEQEYETIVRKYSMTTAATCQTSLDLRFDNHKVFDLVVIDEAARANPLDLFIPMSMGKKIVLVGDHKQLPHMLEPDVLKLIVEDPKFKDLPEIEKSLFERLFDMFSKGQKPKAILLTHQFRMHPDICKFVSEAFYDGRLLTSETVTSEQRSSPVEINKGMPLTFVNIPIEKGEETSGISKSREVEAEAIAKDVKAILKADKKSKIGIITFYSAQANKIKQKLDMTLDSEESDRVEVGTVDAFQGKEYDYVMLSCVRSNRPKKDGEKPKVGFLEKPNRLCVAFSRAIRQLITYGDIETLNQIPCFSTLYNLCLDGKGGHYREY